MQIIFHLKYIFAFLSVQTTFSLVVWLALVLGAQVMNLFILPFVDV